MADKKRIDAATAFLTSDRDYAVRQGMDNGPKDTGAAIIKTNSPNNNPEKVEEFTQNPPVPIDKGFQKVEDLGESASEEGKAKLEEAKDNLAKEQAEAKEKEMADREAAHKEGRKRLEDKMRAHARDNGNFRELERYMLAKKDPDWDFSNDGDADLYYEMKHGKMPKTKDGLNAYVGKEGLDEISRTEEGRKYLRGILARAEADSAKAASAKREKALSKFLSPSK